MNEYVWIVSRRMSSFFVDAAAAAAAVVAPDDNNHHVMVDLWNVVIRTQNNLPDLINGLVVVLLLTLLEHPLVAAAAADRDIAIAAGDNDDGLETVNTVVERMDRYDDCYGHSHSHSTIYEVKEMILPGRGALGIRCYSNDVDYY